MKALLAIALQTIRSSLRSRVFLVLFCLILLALFLLPATVTGDGTAAGQLQIMLTYSLGVVTALVSAATLWISCAVLAREIESYNLHLVMTKPCPAWMVWLGKWLGVFVMNTFLLLVAAIVVYSLILWRLKHGDFSTEELAKVRNEVLVGRRAFRPETPDFAALAQQEYQARLEEGSLNPGHDPKVVYNEILRQVRAKSTEVPSNGTRYWLFEGIKVANDQKPVYLRYRNYAGSTSASSQRLVRGVWGVLDPDAEQQGTFAVLPQQIMTGTFHEITFPGKFVSDNGTVVVSYFNSEPEQQSVVFQQADGPLLLIKKTGFFSNYSRAIILAVLQIAFLAALGCTVGAAFSTPVAVFTAVSYLVIGMTVQAAVRAPVQNELGEFQYSGIWDRILHLIARIVNVVVVSIEEFDATSQLAKGYLVELSQMVITFVSLIGVRGLIVSFLGIWILSRRELGTVVRR